MKSIDSVYISMYYDGVRKVKRFIMKYKIVGNSLTPQIYQALHTDANFMDYDAKDIEIALAHDLYDVVVYDEYDEAIGCAASLATIALSFSSKMLLSERIINETVSVKYLWIMHSSISVPLLVIMLISA